MTVREAKARIQEISDLCKKVDEVKDLKETASILYDTVDILREYQDILEDCIDNAEIKF